MTARRRWLVLALIVIALAGFVVAAAGAVVEARVILPRQYVRPDVAVKPWLYQRTVEEIERAAADGRHPVSPWEQHAIIYWPDPCEDPDLTWYFYWLWGCYAR